MTGKERIALAHDAGCSTDTVRRFVKDPKSVGGGWRQVLEAAAKRLKIDVSGVGVSP